MRIITRKALKDFREQHTQSEQPLKSRYAEMAQHRFVASQQVIQSYPRASSIAGDRIVFRIKGNDYRIVVKINYVYQILWIRFVGTHQEYDNINAKTI